MHCMPKLVLAFLCALLLPTTGLAQVEVKEIATRPGVTLR